MDSLGQLIIDVIKNETEKSTGCTDPGAVALAVSRAGHELSGIAQNVTVAVSPSVYKNSVSVGIPGTGQRGLYMAAALGCLIDKNEKGLSLLEYVNDKLIENAKELVSRGAITIKLAKTSDPLYIKADVKKDNEYATAVIMGDYSNIILVTHNGKTIFEKINGQIINTRETLTQYPLKELWDVILNEIKVQDLDFLISYAKVNKHAAEVGLQNTRTKLGRQFYKYSDGFTKQPYSTINRVQTMTAAAGEARMMGFVVPIMAIAGSGNHGITNYLGTYVIATEMCVSREKIARALAISSIITIYTKEYIKRMTAFCGCSVAAATGVTAAAVYLLGGSFEQAVMSMNSTIGTLGGLFCDGAKESCAYKLSTAAAMALQFAHMAINGIGIPAGMGIIGNSIEDTFYNLGQLNNPGMLKTDKLIVSLIKKTLSQNIGDKFI